jgi:outer membrane biosynthesis protein TonB
VSDAVIDKIRQLLDSSKTEYSIATPIDRLETFFIRIVSAAQQKVHTPSGAVSTTKLGDFLVGQPEGEIKAGIIEQLASKEAEKKSVEQPASTGTVNKPAEVPLPVDHDVLKGLVKPREPAKPVAVKKQTDEPAEEVRQINKNILDELTGSPEAKKNKEDKADKQQGG